MLHNMGYYDLVDEFPLNPYQLVYFLEDIGPCHFWLVWVGVGVGVVAVAVAEASLPNSYLPLDPPKPTV
jgi:hypothetical protein